MKTPYSQPIATTQASAATAGVYLPKDDRSNLIPWLAASMLLHASVVLGVWLVLVILQFLGWNIPLFNSLAVKPRDVEFVLVDNTPEATPRKPTNLRAAHNTRSGGERVANRPLQVPQRAAGAPGQRSVPKPTVKPQPKPQPAQPRQQQAAQPAQRSQPTPKPSPPAPKIPQPRKVANASPALPPNPIAPTIKTPAPPNPSVSNGGPVVKTPGSGTSGGSSSSASGSPGPSMIAGSPSRGGSPSVASTSGGGGSGGHGSYNQGGSPGGGGGAAGVDAMAEPDFGPYIAELQRRIRRNWSPPVEDKSKRVVAMFTISRDGRLVSLRVQQSSGSSTADQAAMAAVRASAPFRPLPANYRGNDIDVQFIFDYEIYNGAKIR